MKLLFYFISGLITNTSLANTLNHRFDDKKKSHDDIINNLYSKNLIQIDDLANVSINEDELIKSIQESILKFKKEFSNLTPEQKQDLINQLEINKHNKLNPQYEQYQAYSFHGKE